MGYFRQLILAAFGILMVVYPSWAVTRVFFTSQESVETELVNLINESHSTIDLALFRFASQPLALAIRRARDRHVRLRLVLDGHPEAEGKTNTVGIAFVAGEVRRLDGKRGGSRGIMHHKFVLFDQARVVTGSFNWTAGAEHVNYENALLIDDSSVVTSYSQEFERLWERAQDVDPGSMDVAASRFEESKIMAPGPAFPTYFSQSFSRKKRHHRRARKSRCW